MNAWQLCAVLPVVHVVGKIFQKLPLGVCGLNLQHGVVFGRPVNAEVLAVTI